MGADGGHGMQLALIVAVDRTGVAPGTDHCGFTRPQALDRPVGAVTESVQTVLHEELSGVPLSLQVRRPRAEGRADAAGGVETASGLLLAADEGGGDRSGQDPARHAPSGETSGHVCVHAWLRGVQPARALLAAVVATLSWRVRSGPSISR